jgi:integrase
MRPRLPPRLYLRKTGLWVILDEGREIATGTRDEAEAQRKLQRYLAGSLRTILERHRDTHPTKTEFGKYMAKPLIAWWGDMTLDDITEEACRAYAQHRGKAQATIRHELQYLASACKRCSKDGQAVRVWLPQPPPPKSAYFLHRLHVAQRLRIARHTHPHICRALLIGIYTGTRPGTVRALRWSPAPGCGWFDLDAETLHRGPEVSPNKRKGRARIHFRLLAHLKRWKKMDGDQDWVIHYRGRPCKSIRRAWDTVTRRAGQEKDAPHICRHTCATWLLQSGVSYHEASGFLSMSVQTLEKRYGHHSPFFQQAAARARGR